MNEKRLEGPGPLHREDGALSACGWATQLELAYDRTRIKAPGWRIKEWDYYLVNDGAYAVALTLGDLGYLGLVSASVIDFAQAAYKTTSVITPFPLGRFRLPSTSREGVSSFENGRVSFRFEAGNGERRLHARFAQFDGDDDLVFDAVLSDEPEETMVIATPWAEDPLAFYYNQKIVAMRARGSFKKGLLVHGFAPDDSFGLLDWGRGVWTRDNTWFWGVAQGWQDGRGGARPGSHCFGLNLGYGFGDTSAASENMAFVDGVCHKLHRVDFGVPEKPAAANARKVAERNIRDTPSPSPACPACSSPWSQAPCTPRGAGTAHIHQGRPRTRRHSAHGCAPFRWRSRTGARPLQPSAGRIQPCAAIPPSSPRHDARGGRYGRCALRKEHPLEY